MEDQQQDNMATAELLQQMGFSTLSTSVLIETLNANEGDVDKTIDHLLTMKATLAASVMPAQAARRDPSDEALQLRQLQLERAHQASAVQPPAKEPEVVPQVPKAAENDANNKSQNSANSNNSNGNSASVASGSDRAPAAPAVQEPAAAQSQLEGKVDGDDKNKFLVEPEEINQTQYPADQMVSINRPIAGLPSQDQVVIVYYEEFNAAVEQAIAGIRSQFQEIGQKDIKTYDLSHDYELMGFIKAKMQGKSAATFPVVFIRDSVVGGLEDVRLLNSTGELKTKVDQALVASAVAGAGAPQLPPNGGAHPRASSSDELSLGILDKTLHYAETLASYLNPMSWFKSSPQFAADQVKEFDVIQSNWYWRNQFRKLRFTGDVFLRVHPRHNDIRAAHKLDQVASITIQDANNIVIKYQDGSSPDWLRCKTTDLPELIKLFREKRTDPTSLIVEGEIPK